MQRARLSQLPLPVLVPLLICAAGLAMWHPGERTWLGASIEGRLLDLRYQWRGPLPAPHNIVIVALDDATLTALQRFPVPRDAIAAAITALGAANARTIAVDLLFIEPAAPSAAGTLAAADQALAAALHAVDGVILAASTAASGGSPNDETLRLLRRNAFAIVVDAPAAGAAAAQPVLLPISPLAAAASLGHVNVATDRDGSLNRIPLAIMVADAVYIPALALEAVRQYLQLPRAHVVLKPTKSVSLGARRLPTDSAGRAMVNYYGGRQAFQTVSLIDVLDGSADPSLFAGKLVMIGSTALGFGDLFNTPFDRALPGVAVHATLAANLLDGSLPLRDRETWIFDLGLAMSGALLAFLAANLRALPLSFAAIAVVALAQASILQAAFSRGGMWLDAVAQICVLLLVVGTTLGLRFLLQRKQAKILARERDNLARYQSPILVDLLAHNDRPEFGDAVRDAAVLFVDVADFTHHAEVLGPRQTADFLRELHGMFERAALAHGGVITQFMGDGAMIVFGLPQAARDDAARALLAGHALLARASDLHAWSKAIGAPVTLRVSLHCGAVIASVLGGERQGQVSVSGDTVNVASRLQEIAKHRGAQLVVSQDALQAARGIVDPQALAGFTVLPGQNIRGRRATIDVWAWPRTHPGLEQATP